MNIKFSALLFFIGAFLSIFIGVSSYSNAADEGLYPAAPPPGSAFIRFFNGAGPVLAPAKIQGKSYGAVSFGQVSPYAPVPRGDASLSLGTESTSLNLKEGAHYIAVLSKGGLEILEEPENTNQLKAQIVLINTSSTPDVSLKTQDGSTVVVDPVSKGKLGGRAVNAVNAPFSLYSAAKKITDLETRTLQRGERYAIVVYDDTNGKTAATFN